MKLKDNHYTFQDLLFSIIVHLLMATHCTRCYPYKSHLCTFWPCRILTSSFNFILSYILITVLFIPLQGFSLMHDLSIDSQIHYQQCSGILVSRVMVRSLYVRTKVVTTPFVRIVLWPHPQVRPLYSQRINSQLSYQPRSNWWTIIQPMISLKLTMK